MHKNPLAEDAAQAEESRPTGPAMDPSVIIEDGAEVGEGTVIWHYSRVLRGSKIGPGCRIGQNVVIGPDVSIGAGCKIQNNVSVYSGVTLEDGVFCGPSMVFTHVRTPRAHISRMHLVEEILVRRGATLGANCTIVCGNTIGRWAFVGAGYVVTRDVPDHAMVTGNPARQTGWVCECGERLDAELRCPACRMAYVKAGKGLASLDAADAGV